MKETVKKNNRGKEAKPEGGEVFVKGLGGDRSELKPRKEGKKGDENQTC